MRYREGEKLTPERRESSVSSDGEITLTLSDPAKSKSPCPLENRKCQPQVGLVPRVTMTRYFVQNNELCCVFREGFLWGVRGSSLNGTHQLVGVSQEHWLDWDSRNEGTWEKMA